MSHELKKKRIFHGKKSLILSNFGHKFVNIPVIEDFSFAKLIRPPDRCGISRSWFNSMLITQVHIVVGTIKGHSKMCSFVTQRHSCLKLRQRAIGVLTVGMSIRAGARECNVNLSSISRLQRCFREFGSTSKQLHNRRPLVCRHMGEQFADVDDVNTVPYGGGGVMVWAGISYGQSTQFHL